ncbi:MAG: SRPBCC family protein, partial [Gemmatimonadetes bacterium]|nr:SRPBCC family protein [Gemmatimonadota bacterium]
MSTVLHPGTRGSATGSQGWDEPGTHTYTSPTPAVRGRTQGSEGWTGSDDGQGLAGFLGWFSIGLGLAQLTAPRGMSRAVGLRPTSRSVAVMRMAGLREIGHGVGILTHPRPKEWVGTRVAGDAMDLAMLGVTFVEAERKDRTLLSTLAVLGITVLDVLCYEQLTESRRTPDGETAGNLSVPVHKSITVERPVEEVYGFWRDFTNLPRFMGHLKSVRVTGAGRSHWTAEGPAGTSAEWDAETTEDRPNERISWRSVGASDLYHAGTVHFRSAGTGRGTMVTVEMQYAPPGGKISA